MNIIDSDIYDNPLNHINNDAYNNACARLEKMKPYRKKLLEIIPYFEIDNCYDPNLMTYHNPFMRTTKNEVIEKFLNNQKYRYYLRLYELRYRKILGEKLMEPNTPQNKYEGYEHKYATDKYTKLLCKGLLPYCKFICSYVKHQDVKITSHPHCSDEIVKRFFENEYLK